MLLFLALWVIFQQRSFLSTPGCPFLLSPRYHSPRVTPLHSSLSRSVAVGPLTSRPGGARVYPSRYYWFIPLSVFFTHLPFTPYLILPVSRFLGVNMAIRHGGRPYFTLLARRLGVQRVPPVPGGGVSLPPPSPLHSGTVTWSFGISVLTELWPEHALFGYH